MTVTINSAAPVRSSHDNRVEALDWLRGLMAFSIMLFHLGGFGYLSGPFDTSTILGKIGIYGVSVFFVLSGLSMAIGYNYYFSGIISVVRFIVRRIFRIWPLLWIVIAYVVILDFFHDHKFSIALIAANITTLFGFIKPYAYINMGAWSIGNEMVYYSLTPLFIYAYNRKMWVGNLLTISTIVVGMIFCFFLLSPESTLQSQWKTYINPFNNMFFYCIGISLYYNTCTKKHFSWSSITLGLAICVTFLLFPVSGDQVHIVVGINRIVFSAMAVATVFLVYTLPLRLPLLLAKPMEQLGLATYGVYLLHPIAISILTSIFKRLRIESDIAFPVVVVILTIAAAIASFRYFELPLVKLGKKVTTSISNRRSRLIDSSPSTLLAEQAQL